MRHAVAALAACLASALIAPAQGCGSSPRLLRTYDPWQASFFYGWNYDFSLQMLFDLDVQAPVTVHELWMTTYNQGVGSPIVPDQVGNIAEVRVYLIPGTWTGNNASPAGWGVAAPASGQPDIRGELTVVAWPGTSPIRNFKDALGNPATFTLPAGQYGVCLEILPTNYTGTPLVLQNPGRLSTIGFAPNTGAITNDDLLTIRNDRIVQDGWFSVDANGALVPNPTPSFPIDSINLGIDYTPAMATAIWTVTGPGCYATPPSLALSARPVLGTTIDAVVADLDPATATPFGGFVTVATDDAGAPVSLAQFGLTGCQAHFDFGAVLFCAFLANPNNTEMRWTLPIPTAVLGLTLHLQAATLTPNAGNAAGILVSNGVCVRPGM
ncbi:MAG: hypothetical protein H6838_10665 [Planctomycetes bacterium]|nr:hypothetical protein [Planctomycetota bacterium]MCB9885948.1 hypothetical protein [Planctomycetota bacterium]